MSEANITREQLINLLNQLTASQGSWNHCEAGEDRGPKNDALTIVIYDDGSGFVATYSRFKDEHFINEQCQFRDADEAANYLIEYHQALEKDE